jgi:thiol-disulfide isomerase/thioredoxin
MLLLLMPAACTPKPAASAAADASATPPPKIKAWMDRLTVAHEYDPKTGFIVAREVVALPPLVADAPPLDAAVKQAGGDRVVVVFVTADRCAPCQQYKRDALNDASVIARLSDARFLPTHLEVDRSAALADAYLGTRSIPMTYALRNGKVIAELRGQRSAADLVAWIDAMP